MNTYNLTALTNQHCQLGENPLWNVNDQSIYWEDIDGGKVHRLKLEDKKHEVIYEGPKVGGFTFQTNGDLLLFRINDLALLHPDGKLDVLRTFEDEGMERFNDVIADPEGRVFAGTIGKTDESGGLYRVDLDGNITQLWSGTRISNGMGFSPDLKTFYWTCSTSKRIYRFPYNRETGEIGSRSLFYQATEDEGTTDGLTVDASGHVWSARWDGFAVIHHGTDGKVLGKIELPVGKVTSLCFGGPHLNQFLITTAGGKDGADTADGTLYQADPGTSGPAEFQSRIGI